MNKRGIADHNLANHEGATFGFPMLTNGVYYRLTTLVQTLGTNVYTSHGIIARGEDGVDMARGGRREEVVVVTLAVVNLLVNLVQANPAYTLVQLQTLVAQEGIHVSTISITHSTCIGPAVDPYEKIVRLASGKELGASESGASRIHKLVIGAR